MPDSVTPPSAAQPVDADRDLHVPAQRRELAGASLGILLAISVGGVLGALARYGLGVAFPHGAAGFPWATFAVNVTGCGLTGVLMVCIDQLGAHRLVRPFLGVGVLGGFTTFPLTPPSATKPCAWSWIGPAFMRPSTSPPASWPALGPPTAGWPWPRH